MMSIVAKTVVTFLLLVGSVSAFRSSMRTTSIISSPNTLSSSTNLNMFKKKEVKPEVDANDYWQGEWICADCGYIYDQDVDGGGLYFEQLKKGFVCPQCSAPRRRYAKKVGDQWGVTNDGGDFPIYFMTFLGLAATTWFSLVYVPTM